MKLLAELLIDFAGVVGLAAISYGAWAIYEPAGFIAGGVMVVAVVLRLQAALTAERAAQQSRK